MLRKKIFRIALSFILVIPSQSFAQSLIRDAEIERTLKMISRPLINTAGLSQSRVKIFIVNDPSLNAFIAGGSHLFLHQGLIRKLPNVEQLQAVIGHEVGHITGGHLAQRSVALSGINTAAGIGLLLGLAAVVAGKETAGLIGLAAIGHSIGQRNFLIHTRSQESSADQSGVRYMAAAGIDPKAAIDVLKIFQDQNLVSAKYRDPYSLTHPISQERINNLRTLVAAYRPKLSRTKANNISYWHARMIAKLNAFLGRPSSVLQRLKASDKGEIATLTRAIAYHRKPNRKKALNEITRLIKMRPKDAYYQELYGQILLENGNVKAAISAYRTATSLAKNEPLILAGLGRALNAANTNATNKEALKILQKSYAKDSRNGRMLRELAVAYARANKIGMAASITAERYALNSNFKQAAIHAKRAQKLLPKGSSGWLISQDILIIAKRTKAKK